MSVAYFKLFVKDRGEPTINTLTYIAANIRLINNMGVRLSITKINADEVDQALLKKLRARNINSYPTLITDNGTVFVGYKKIKAVFERNKDRFTKTQSAPAMTPRGDFGNNPDLAELYASEMSLSAIERDKQSGRGDEEMTGGLDDRNLNRVMSDQMAKRRITSATTTTQFEVPRRGNTASQPADNIRHPEDDILMSKSPDAPVQPVKSPKKTGPPSMDDMFDERFMQGATDDY